MNQHSMLLLIFRQDVLAHGTEEKIHYLAISLDEKWHYFIAQDCSLESLAAVKAMASLYLEKDAIIEVSSRVLDVFGAAFMLDKMGYPNKLQHDEFNEQVRREKEILR